MRGKKFIYQGVMKHPKAPIFDRPVLLKKTIKFYITRDGTKFRQSTGKQPNVEDRTIAAYLDLDTVHKLQEQTKLCGGV